MGPQLFLLYTAELFSIVENMPYGYADDSTLVAVVPSSGERVAVSESMNRDLFFFNNFISTRYDTGYTYETHSAFPMPWNI